MLLRRKIRIKINVGLSFRIRSPIGSIIWLQGFFMISPSVAPLWSWVGTYSVTSFAHWFGGFLVYGSDDQQH